MWLIKVNPYDKLYNAPCNRYHTYRYTCNIYMYIYTGNKIHWQALVTRTTEKAPLSMLGLTSTTLSQSCQRVLISLEKNIIQVHSLVIRTRIILFSTGSKPLWSCQKCTCNSYNLWHLNQTFVYNRYGWKFYILPILEPASFSFERITLKTSFSFVAVMHASVVYLILLFLRAKVRTITV